jgi:hypothetical protein
MCRGLVVSLSLLAFFGCAGPSLRSRMAAYIGADDQTLVQQLGVPDKQITVGGIQYVAYNQSWQELSNPIYMGSWYGPYAGPFYGAVPGYYLGGSPQIIVYSCETTFMLKYGRVFNFTMRGNGCD